MNQVRVDQGILEGNQRSGVFRFRGIPFAAPPVGEWRWAAPQPPAAWDGVRDATQFGKAAIQTVDTGVDLGAQPSEDCLYLNVWTASLDPQARQPVMVWIHGGGFLNLAASMPEWHGGSIAHRGDHGVVQLPARRIRLPLELPQFRHRTNAASYPAARLPSAPCS